MKTLAFLSGILFGIGLLVSGMTDPAKVIAFLDIAGAWDPSLILVMITAVLVALVPMQMAQRRAKSVIGEKIAFPTTSGITGKLILGSAIFGVGWGMTGLCPGPSLASLAASTWQEWLFFGSMVVGMTGFEIWQRAGSRVRALPAAQLTTPRKT
ncbi:MAG: YeeE/YedE family protein [Burkholderiaceae bacterium]|nr:YeeE/YedE family protein [Burkholderiaceae bacterium]